ncbi:RagB/SusD family nutrient uptake outer membrane protein [Parapedobacter koreensis]|nr:RagB/SusD family nutrient uptake outer membrane protein [Parapedobacter koreensis]
MKHIIAIAIAAIFLLSSCENYLAMKPDKALAVPNGLSDMQALLDATRFLNESRPAAHMIASDNLYIEDADWNALYDVTSKNAYTWQRDVFNDFDTNDWTNTYAALLHTNVIIDGIGRVDRTLVNGMEWDAVKGGALFHRAMAFYELAQLFAKPYDASAAETDLGVVLRLEPAIDQPSVRASLQQTYQQIVGDLKGAVPLLPIHTEYVTRPSKLAALGLLARTYLVMGEYGQALEYANEFLGLNSELMDFNTKDVSLANPIEQFNEEVVYHSTAFGWPGLSYPSAKVDTLLYRSYADNDLRKTLFFEPHASDDIEFRGSYNGARGLFTGIATDELYLIRAECRARLGQWKEAMEDLNELLEKRYIEGSFIDFDAADAEEALNIVLQERRKELIFRGLRWTDLRRLNNDPRFAVEIMRTVNGQAYRLSPDNGGYIFPIPLKVIESSGIPQNK